MLLKRLLPVAMSCLTLNAAWPNAGFAQTPPEQAAAQSTVLYTQEQLDALLAPIALYPDQLLTQVLMASSFPLEVVDAARWVQDPNNAHLSGPALEASLQPLPWDPSVKSLVPFPTVLALLNAKLDWMQQVGYAFSVQQADVLGSVQRLRWQAQRAGHLNSSPQQLVQVQQQTIVIEPAQPDVVFVPAYNPMVVYGAWGYPDYPPVYFGVGYPGYYGGNALVAGIAFGVGIAVVGSLWGWARPSWGWGPHWGGGYVNVNRNVYNRITVNNVHNVTIVNNRWAGNGRPWGGFARPPAGPVGVPRAATPAGWHPPVGTPAHFAGFHAGSAPAMARPSFTPAAGTYNHTSGATRSAQPAMAHAATPSVSRPSYPVSQHSAPAWQSHYSAAPQAHSPAAAPGGYHPSLSHPQPSQAPHSTSHPAQSHPSTPEKHPGKGW